MIDIQGLLDSEWFTEDGPFRGTFNLKNPKIVIITGGNATGKSLFRKLIQNEYADRHIELMHVSQARRSRPGLERMLVYGSEEDQSTGFNSTQTLLKMIQTSKAREKSHSILLDEPEIGCSEELAAGLAFRLASEFPSLTNMECCYIISHSREFIKQCFALKPSHVHLQSHPQDFTSLATWVHRQVEPVYELEKLVDAGHDRWHGVQKIINRRRQST